MNDATDDHETISRWWRTYPRAAIGIATGAKSGLLVIDVDPRHDGERNLDNLLAGRKLPDTPECITGGAGRHIYCAYPDAQIGNTPLARGVDVRGSNGYVVAPPSSHASGDRYRWDPPGLAQEVAAVPSWLLALLIDPRTPYLPDSQLAVRANPRRPLSPRIASLLKHGDASGDYHSRSEVVQAITAGARSHGWTFEELFVALLEPSNTGGERLQQRTAERARSDLHRSWEVAGRLTHSQPTAASVNGPRVDALQATLDTHQWTDTTGQTDWAVAQALIDIIARTDKTEISASAREVAELAGITRTTASKSLLRLQERGVISLADPAHDGLAAVYRLQLDDTQHTDTPEGV